MAGPTTDSLTRPFGLQPLIGKSVAIVSDARFHGDGIPILCERLLCISGEDTLTIDQKFQSSLTMKLGVRVVFLSNELPRFSDASGAFASRFLILRMTKSYFGMEDPTLLDRLCKELPGIMKLCLDAYSDLRRRGHFIQPRSVQDAVEELADLASPISAFIRDKCDVRAGLTATPERLFIAWRTWCTEQGRDHVGIKSTFCRDLRTALPQINLRRVGSEGERERTYEGIGVK